MKKKIHEKAARRRKLIFRIIALLALVLLSMIIYLVWSFQYWVDRQPSKEELVNFQKSKVTLLSKKSQEGMRDDIKALMDLPLFDKSAKIDADSLVDRCYIEPGRHVFSSDFTKVCLVRMTFLITSDIKTDQLFNLMQKRLKKEGIKFFDDGLTSSCYSSQWYSIEQKPLKSYRFEGTDMQLNDLTSTCKNTVKQDDASSGSSFYEQVIFSRKEYDENEIRDVARKKGMESFVVLGFQQTYFEEFIWK